MTGGTNKFDTEPDMAGILDYAIAIGIVVTMTLTTALIWAGAQPGRTVLVMAVLGGVWTFTVTPYLVAWWVDRDVDELLDTPG